MDYLHSSITRQDIEYDPAVTATCHLSSASSCSKKDRLSETHFSLPDAVTDIACSNRVPLSVTTDNLSLPIDITIAIGEHLMAADLPRYFSINRAMNTVYRTDKIGYAKSLSKIGSALRLPEILEALAAITQYTAENQPFLFRALSQNVRMQTQSPMYGATEEWENRIDAQFDWHEAHPSGPERDLALRQLIIARGLALAERLPARKGITLRSVIGNRLDKVSPEHWPPIFEALLPNDYLRHLLQACKFTEKFTGNVSSVSREFSLLIALEFLCKPHFHQDVSTLLRQRFNVSDACMQAVLDPHIANTIAEAMVHQASHVRASRLMLTARLWRQDDHCFASLVTDAFLKLFDEKVYRSESFSDLLHRDFAKLPDVRRRVRERTIMLEGPTISALRDDEEKAEKQVDAFLKIIHRIGKPARHYHHITLLGEIIGLPRIDAGMPLVARPALLHRLVSNPRIGWDDRHAVQMFIDATTECRNTLKCRIALISSNMYDSPLLSRVSAALIMGAVHLRKYDASAANAIIAEASEWAFSHVAPQDWGDVLQALIYDKKHDIPTAAEKWERIDKHAAVFVCLPDSSVRYFHDLSIRVEKIVGSVWRHLPDKADGSKSRFDVFKQRVGIKPGMGGIALASIAESLVPEVVAGVHLLEDVASASGFDSLDAIDALELALFRLKIRTTLHADSDIDAVTTQYTKQSLYLRSLIARAVYDFGILADVNRAVA